MFPGVTPLPLPSQGTSSHSSLRSGTQSKGTTWSCSPCKLTKLVKSGARGGREHCDVRMCLRCPEWVASRPLLGSKDFLWFREGRYLLCLVLM